jgi:hypothetical protein
MPEEEWLPVREFPGHYEISSTGRLRRINPYRPNQANKIRKPQIARNGYVVYMLSVDNCLCLRSAHRMVADAFLGPIPEGMQVNHKDGDKGNPRVENLEIVTNSENRVHSYRILGVPHYSYPRGIKNHKAKLTFVQISEIREKYSSGLESYRTLARAYSTTTTTISRIVKNRTRLEA